MGRPGAPAGGSSEGDDLAPVIRRPGHETPPSDGTGGAPDAALVRRVAAAVVATGARRFGEPDGLATLLDDVRVALEVDGLALLVKDPTSGTLDPAGASGRVDPPTSDFPLQIGSDTVGRLVVGGPVALPAAAMLPLASALALAVRGHLLFDGVQSRARDLDREVLLLMALQEIAAAVTRTDRAGEVARVVAMHARRLVHGVSAAVIGVGTLEEAETLGAEGNVRPVAVTAALAAMRSGVQQLVPGPLLALPISVDVGAPAALVVARDGEAFTGDDIEHLVALGQQAGIAFTNARLVENLRREQERREQIAAALVTAQERERQRIAEDIHDGPVQELAGLGLLIDAIAQRSDASDQPDSDLVREASRLARGIIGTLREAIFDLHPMSIQKLGFSSAVRVVLSRTGCERMQTEMDGLDLVDALPDQARTLAFRVVQEAVANSTRHSEASLLRVDATLIDGGLCLSVIDDGVGFNPEAVPERIGEGHLGLEAMRQRALLAGATLTITSAPDAGTSVTMTFPEPAGGDTPPA